MTWRQPDVPRELAARVADTTRYQQAWSRIRGGDLGNGERELSDLLRAAPTFYPAAASLGELRLQRRDYGQAGVFFGQALTANATYLPALVGMVDARLGAGDDPGALAALKVLLSVDATRADARARHDVVSLRVSQSELALAERFRAAAQLEEAERHLTLALDAAPENGPALRALAAVQLGRGALDSAAARAQQAVALDPQDAVSLALLGDILEAQNRYADAAAAYGRAVALDPRPAWTNHRARLMERSDAMSLPESYRAIAGATSVTRAQVAAVLGVRLAGTLQQAPTRVTDVVTDVRAHWASAWILPVVRAGWIEPRPNHTFEPGGPVRRSDLARVVLAVLDTMATARRSALDVSGATSRITFADMTRDHAAFRAAALAVASGIMSADATNRFLPAGVVSGSDLLATISRLEARAK